MSKEYISKEEKEREEELIRKAFREDPELSAMVERFDKKLKADKKRKEEDNLEKEREKYA